MNRHERRKAKKLNQQIHPTAAQPLINKEDVMLGQALKYYRRNNIKEAIDAFMQILKINPDNAAALCYLGIFSLKVGVRDRALELLSRSLKLVPDNPEGWLHLGNLHTADNVAEAEKCYHRAIRLNPQLFEAYIRLGFLYRDEHLYNNALTVFSAAVELDPQSVEALRNIAYVYMLQDKAVLGIEAMNKVLVINPDYVPAHINLAGFYLHQGIIDKSLHHYRCARKIDSVDPSLHSEYLFAMHSDPQITREEIYNETLHWAALHISDVLPLTHANEPNPTRRLRIGYVSADLAAHAVAQYIEPVLRSHDKSVVETFCYCNNRKSDVVTERLQSYPDHWRDITQLTDGAAAKLVQEDKIDILIDLSGHTLGNRLLMFAYKPAPLQATWIGYFNTTGVKAIDYIITDRFLLPPEEEHLYVEKPLRLPNSGAVFNIHTFPIEVNPLPALTNGHVTFGCFNALLKFTPEVTKLWAEILHRVPNSRLYMKNKGFDSEDTCEQYRNYFSELGINRERLTIAGTSTIQTYLRCYNDVDLGLDPFPYNGSTTTLDSLWMGVPVITIKGDRLVAHIGESLLGAVGLTEFVAVSKEQYIEKAVAMANNLSRLAEVRRTLRQALTAAPITNPVIFTRGLEAAFRDIWKEWCQKRNQQ